MIKWAITVLAVSFFLVFLLDQQNQVMAAQMHIERAKKERRLLGERSDQLMLALASTHNPKWLLDELSTGQFSHLHFPSEGEVIYLELERP